jgi:Trk-type K+ transport system membrane component
MYNLAITFILGGLGLIGVGVFFYFQLKKEQTKEQEK